MCRLILLTDKLRLQVDISALGRCKQDTRSPGEKIRKALHRTDLKFCDIFDLGIPFFQHIVKIVYSHFSGKLDIAHVVSMCH